MKLKNVAWVAGAIALTLSTIPYAVQAQTTPPSTQPSATETHEKGPWQKLGLTDAQKAQIKQIRSATRAKFEAILTPDQLAKFKAEHQAGQHKRGGMSKDSLNLTDAQKAQMHELWKSQESQIEAVLTPEQLAQFKQLRQAHRHPKNRTNP